MRIAVLCSGGDAPGMNAVLRSVVRTALSLGHEVYGVQRGFRGLIEGNFEKLTSRSVGGIINRGGTFLLSARDERFKETSWRHKAYKNLEDNGIEGLIVLGGEGTFKGCSVLARESGFGVIGVPCTIDNDVGGTEYCVGFDTAVLNAVECIDMIRDTASSHERVFIVEVMGRKRGFIALRAGVATGADLILIPEVDFPFERIPEEIKKAKDLGKMHFIAVVAEGYGSAQELRDLLGKRIGQRYGEIRSTVLGHIQRGGSPSPFDRLMGMKFGEIAVEALVSGERAGFVAYRQGKFFIEDFSKADEHKDIDRDLLRLWSRLNQ